MALFFCLAHAEVVIEFVINVANDIQAREVDLNTTQLNPEAVATGKFRDDRLLINISSSIASKEQAAHVWGFVEGYMTRDLINSTYTDVVESFGLSNYTLLNLTTAARRFRRTGEDTLLHCFLDGMVQATAIEYEKLYILNMYNELYTLVSQTDYVPGRELLVRNFGVV